MACLDTAFLIDLLAGEPKTAAVLEDLGRSSTAHAVCPVSAAEVYVGAHRGSAIEYQRAQELLESLRWLPFDRATARRAGRLQAELFEDGMPIGFTDCMIAASALEHGEVLVTADGDFDRIEDLRTVEY